MPLALDLPDSRSEYFSFATILLRCATIQTAGLCHTGGYCEGVGRLITQKNDTNIILEATYNCFVLVDVAVSEFSASEFQTAK
jgi:hypothetical protein